MDLGRIGFFTMAGGFLYGAFILVQHPDRVSWVPYGIAFVITAAGAAMLRVQQGKSGGDTEKVKSDMSTIVTSLAALAEKVTAINAGDRKGSKLFALPARIDADCIDHINDFVDAREAMIHRHGLEHYARMMDSFALGERALNRAWCAAADGYIDEVNTCLDRAERYIKGALEIVEGIDGGDAPPAAGDKRSSKMASKRKGSAKQRAEDAKRKPGKKRAATKREKRND